MLETLGRDTPPELVTRTEEQIHAFAREVRGSLGLGGGLEGVARGRGKEQRLGAEAIWRASRQAEARSYRGFCSHLPGCSPFRFSGCSGPEPCEHGCVWKVVTCCSRLKVSRFTWIVLVSGMYSLAIQSIMS